MDTTAILTSPLAAALRSDGLVGRLVEPADPDYDRARAGWKRRGRPPAVVRASDADDVAAAIRAARDAGLASTVRRGGHSVLGRSVRDGALCIDSGRSTASTSIPARGSCGSVVGRCSVSSTRRPSGMGSPCPPVRSRTPASAG